jgi:hypothetical protein
MSFDGAKSCRALVAAFVVVASWIDDGEGLAPRFGAPFRMARPPPTSAASFLGSLDRTRSSLGISLSIEPQIFGVIEVVLLRQNYYSVEFKSIQDRPNVYPEVLYPHR